MHTFKNVLGWLKKNERHVSTLMYLWGFASHIVEFVILPVAIANLFFIYYLAGIAVCILGSYFLSVRGYDSRPQIFWRIATLAFRWGILAFIGSALGGFLVFYTKSAFVFTSWPFLLLLAIVFFGNEFLHSFKSHIIFQTTLFFFAIYAYVIFGLPLVVHQLGPEIFLESTGVAVGILAVFILLLALVNWTRIRGALRGIALGVVGTLLIVVGAYYTGLIPPIPLTLVSAEVAQSVTRTSQGYTVQVEHVTEHKWWEFAWPQTETIQHVSGTPLSVFSSVFAPTDFGTAVVHKWEWFNPQTHKWQTQAQIAFPIAGGRNGGYRGYSTITNVPEGKYRVSIETLSGQTIGRISFTVQDVQSQPRLQTVTR